MGGFTTRAQPGVLAGLPRYREAHSVVPWEPESVLAEDVWAPRVPRQPEKRLMLAVLEDALALLSRPRPTGRPSVSRVNDQAFHARDRVLARQEALAWIASPDCRWPYSFENVCAALELDPDWLRRRVATLPAGQPGRRARPIVRSAVGDRLGLGAARTRGEAAQRREAPGLGRGAG